MTTPDAELDRARELLRRRDWDGCFAAFVAADEAEGLDVDGLISLATAATMSGRDEHATTSWIRAHQALVQAGDIDDAARCAFWLVVGLLLRGEAERASGWLSRARPLLGDDTTGRGAGYLAIIDGLGALDGDEPPDVALERFELASRAGDAAGDPELATLGRLGRGQALASAGDFHGAVALLDEAMVRATDNDVSPALAGIVYCAVIESCEQQFDVRRAQRWTAALEHWCDAQSGLVAFRGQCLVHRATLLRLHGAWDEGFVEAARACVLLSEPPHPAAGAAHYQHAEMHRLVGDVAAAQDAYRSAATWGHSSQPGLALLWLAQGKTSAAAAAIRRTLDESHPFWTRATLLAAATTIMLAAGDPASARRDAEALDAMCATLGEPAVLQAMADDALGATALATGDVRAALRSLRSAWSVWRDVDAPYEASRTRVLIGLACRALGDEESAAIELDDARDVFERLGARPDVETIERLRTSVRPEWPGGLSPREVEVLGLLARGLTNREIGADLVISERTVARHLSNIFAKIGVATRSAATAYAYEQHLV
ncbi:MAG: LuxR C-terminal-related transcriptional regulator [Ilumatobacteraceae bacterium]